MKTLLLLRHGKAEDRHANGDAARTLTKRGVTDAEEVTKSLAAQGKKPDVIITSPAVRARQTGVIAAWVFGIPGELPTDDAIYEAEADTLLEVIQRLPDTARTVMLVGHNPGFAEIGAMLAADGLPGLSLPPAGAIALEFATDAWQNITPRAAQAYSILRPEGR